MPHAMMKLKPGIDTQSTVALNDGMEYSSANLIRFLPDRDGQGLIQKMGGWVSYYSSPITSTIRALKGWADLNSNNYLGIGAESSLSALSGGNLIDITPRIQTTNVAPVFATTAGSTTVTIIDSASSTITLDYVYFVTPVAVGGIVLQGPYAIQSSALTTYTITAASAATSTANTSTNTVATALTAGKTYKIVTVGTTDFTLIGAASNTVGTIFNATAAGAGTGTAKLVGVPAFSTSNGSSIITTYLDNHGYSVGSQFYVGVSTTIGGVTIFGTYTILSVPSAHTFTFSATNTATSNAGPTAINSGNVRSVFYLAVDAQPTGTGFGVGGFGVGGFGVGTTTTTYRGSTITATDWTLDNYGQDLIACPAGGAIYYWQPDGQIQNAQILGEQCPLVNDGIFVAMPERQVVAYGSSFTLDPDPLLIRWSDVNDFTTWIGTATNQAGSYRIPTGSKIVTALQGPQQALFWTDLDLWAMQYVGPPLVYGFNKIASNCGAISRHCVGQLNNGIFWMSQKQFFMNLGQGAQVIPCSVWDAVFQNLKSGTDGNGNPYTNRIVCAVNSQFNEVMWFYPSASSTGENDSYVKYNVQMNCWDYGSLGRTAWIDQSVLGPPIGSGSDNYIYQHEIGNDASNGNQVVAMNSAGYTGYYAINEADNLVFIDQIWPDMKWGNYNGTQNATVNMTFYATNYAGDTPVQYGPYQMTEATQYLSVRIRARLIQVAISSDDVGTFWRLGAMRYRYQPDGRF